MTCSNDKYVCLIIEVTQLSIVLSELKVGVMMEMSMIYERKGVLNFRFRSINPDYGINFSFENLLFIPLGE
jgi:hypothetical protein